MKIEYVGTLETGVPSASATGVKTGSVLTVSETVALRLLVISQAWKAADAEAEALTPTFGEVVLVSPQSIDAFNPVSAYTGGVVVTEAGMRYRSLYASVGETPSLASWAWQRLGIVDREGMQAQVEVTPPESTKPSLVFGVTAGSALAAKAGGNVALGPHALAEVTTGSQNTAVGWAALDETTTANANTAVGYLAGNNTTTGAENTAVGTTALSENAVGNANTAIGKSALEKATGVQNTGVGASALGKATTASSNTAVGTSSLGGVTEGGRNTAVGTAALLKLTTGNENVAIGEEAGKALLTGSKNVFVGMEAGAAETGSNKLHIANNGTMPIIKGVMSATEANQEIGFLGAAPVKRAAHPTTLAEVITILEKLGFCS